MPVPGRYHRVIFGADEIVRAIVSAGGGSTFAMAALNAGYAARFMAPDTRDIAGVWVNWSTVTTPGTVQLRIETVDASTGKPTGTLYDASALLNFTPVAGWQQLTFATLPTTGLVAGNEYCIVLLTTVGGTTMTLRAYAAAHSYPAVPLTAADGTTRSNFAEISGSCPAQTFFFEDGSEELLAFCPYATVSAANIFGTNACGMKFVVGSGVTLKLAGVEITRPSRIGVPAGDLRVRIFNSSDQAVAGATVTLDKDSLTGVNGLRIRAYFNAIVSLTAGTYRVVLDSSASANSSNCWRLSAATARVAGNVPSGFLATSTTDVTAGTISWTDLATDLPSMGLMLDDVAGGGGLPLGRTVGGL